MTKNQTQIEQSILKSVELTAFLMQKQFQLANIGLSDKIAFDWTKAGLYLEEKKTAGRRKYNAVEYVWLRLVKDLREFGMSYEALKNLRGFLMTRIDIQRFMIEIMEAEAEEQDIEIKVIQKLMKDTIKSKKELQEAFDDAENPLMDTVLCVLIHQTVLLKGNMHLLIKKDGYAMVTDGEPFDPEIIAGDILNGPYIAYPLRHILTEFVAREDLYTGPIGKSVIELSADEQKVLDLLRQGNIVSLSVRLNNGEIKLIETEENIDVKEVKGKLVDYIKRNSYQEITYKTENGKIVNLKRKTKHK